MTYQKPELTLIGAAAGVVLGHHFSQSKKDGPSVPEPGLSRESPEW